MDRGRVACEVADAAIEKFGGDSMREIEAKWQAFREHTTARFQPR